MGRQNRGPAAAQANREALMRSARTLFAQRGLDIPFSSIARDAHVSQGVLYRHFPSRVDLAVAVFEENVAELERCVRDAPDDEAAVQAVWAKLVRLTVTDVAFVEMAVRSTEDPRLLALRGRVEALINPALQRLRLRDLQGQLVEADSLLFGLRAIYGLVITRSPEDPVIWDDISRLLNRLALPAALSWDQQQSHL